MVDRFVGEEIIPQFLVKSRILPANPLQQHGGMFLFFIPVVRKDCPEFGVFTGIGPLVGLCQTKPA